ncbi:hypothetical protein AVEN_45923-1 [Araneus ventricosus]|uniref:Uncharacterized protein n=1 Tax=Araneus ventricosus TaxID=182803 RepID=A0A4Y2EBQ6_ARAVE|nr:hypothetical protein AVEN_45923-1 [Araneus ventricosus]
MPLEREPSLRDGDFVDFLADSKSFYIGSVSLPNFWYREKLQEFVLQFVKLSSEKLLTLSRILKNERKIHSYWESSLCVVRYDLGVICFESNHNGVAKGAIIRFDGRGSTLDISPRVCEIHTYGGFQAQGHVDHDIYIIHEMIMDCTFEFIPSLLRHGFALKFDDKGYKQLQESLIMDELLEDEAKFVAERKMSTRRSYLLMQVLHISSFIDDYPELGDNEFEVLRMIWRSIPDPVLSRNEIQHAYNGVLEKDYLNWLITIYQHSVDEFPVKTQPRSLKHLARVSVRKALSDNQKLPDGLDCIGLLPPPVLSLLKLEK